MTTRESAIRLLLLLVIIIIDIFRKTALHVAIENDRLPVVRLLIESDAKIDARDSAGCVFL